MDVGELRPAGGLGSIWCAAASACSRSPPTRSLATRRPCPTSAPAAAIQQDTPFRLDFNRELTTIGISNIACGALGCGFTGSLIFSQTIFTGRAGVLSRVNGAGGQPCGRGRRERMPPQSSWQAGVQRLQLAWPWHARMPGASAACCPSGAGPALQAPTVCGCAPVAAAVIAACEFAMFALPISIVGYLPTFFFGSLLVRWQPCPLAAHHTHPCARFPCDA